MTDELKACLKDHRVHELDGQRSYEELACKMEKCGHHDFAGVLRDMAHEEWIHSKLLAEMLNET